MSYTLYIDTIGSSIILGEQNLKLKSDILFAAYPNPATDNLHINLSLDKTDDYTITIITALGQPVKQLFTGKTAGLSADYNISSLEGGLYFVEALCSDGRKIVKLSIIK
jgi:hypothetical protein